MINIPLQKGMQNLGESQKDLGGKGPLEVTQPNPTSRY